MNDRAPQSAAGNKTLPPGPGDLLRATPPQIPDHELLRRVGEGAYGEVWLAKNVMGTYRAVKIVYRSSFSDDRPYEREFAGIKRFEPISRAHASQVDILHVGRNDAAGYFYYVMELADDAAPPRDEDGGLRIEDGKAGIVHPLASILDPQRYTPRTLRTEIQRRGRLPFEGCLDLALALTTALEHLHQNGLMHRDIKPANIIFVNGQPKLADIGLVTDVDATKSFVGTEGYIPPEGPTTQQADIYSLGKVLYEAATGRDRQDFPELPSDVGQCVPPAPVSELVRKEGKAGRTALRSFSDGSGLLELNEIILKACAADPKQRYQNANEMHADLLLLKTGRSVKHTRRLERRLALVTRVGITAAIAGLLAMAAFLYQKAQARHAFEIFQKEQKLHQEADIERQKAIAAEREQARLRKKAEIAQAKEVQLRLLAEAREKINSARFISRYGDTNGVEKAMKELRTLLTQMEPESAAAIHFYVGDWLASKGHWREATTNFDKGIEEEPSAYDNYHGLIPVLVQTGELDRYQQLRAQILERFGRTTDPKVAERVVKDCLILPCRSADFGSLDRLADSAVRGTSNHWASGYFQFAKGLAEYRQARYASAIEWMQRTLTKSGQDPNRNVEAYMLLAMSHQRLNSRAEMRAAMAKGLEIAGRQLHKLDSDDLGWSWGDCIFAHALMTEASTLIGRQSEAVGIQPVQKQ